MGQRHREYLDEMYDCSKDKKVDDDILELEEVQNIKKGLKMESQDYDKIKQEEKEEIDRQVYQEHKKEFEDALNNVLSQAFEELELSDIIEIVQNGLDDNSHNEILTIKKEEV